MRRYELELVTDDALRADGEVAAGAEVAAPRLAVDGDWRWMRGETTRSGRARQGGAAPVAMGH